MLDVLSKYGDPVMSLLVLVLGYLLGSISFGIILPRILANVDDIRNMGSGNAGTTNVLRTQGKKLALLVLLGDLCKGLVGAWLGFLLAGALGAAFASFGTIIGHCYPVFFGFKGGKGVATGIGTIFVIDFRIGIIASLVFISVILITKYVSLGSILGAASVYFLTPFFAPALPVFIYCLFAASFVIWRHHSNIVKLLRGTETRLDQFQRRSVS